MHIIVIHSMRQISVTNIALAEGGGTVLLRFGKPPQTVASTRHPPLNQQNLQKELPVCILMNRVIKLKETERIHQEKR